MMSGGPTQYAHYFRESRCVGSSIQVGPLVEVRWNPTRGIIRVTQMLGVGAKNQPLPEEASQRGWMMEPQLLGL